MAFVVQHHCSLKALNTFGIEATAEALVEIQSIEDLRDAVRLGAEQFDNALFVLGGGSNVLFTGTMKGLVVRIGLRGIRIIAEDAHTVHLEAAAGEVWDDIVQYCVARNWGGLENLSLIPGTVGAAPVQNIGAYGVELRDVLLSVQGLMRSTGELKTFSREECHLSYRDSIFKNALRGQCIITAVQMRLRKNPASQDVRTEYGAIRDELLRMFPNHKPHEYTIQKVSEVVRSIRRSKLPDPAHIGNAGSFFKNPVIPVEQYDRLKADYPAMPAFAADTNGQQDGKHCVKIPAAWLIETCGWKGKRVGNTGTHSAQALVLVNHGQATGQEIYECAETIQRDVQTRFNIRLQMEVHVV